MGIPRLSTVIRGVRQRDVLSRLGLREEHLQWLLVLATMAAIAVHYVSLEVYPPVFIDEPWYSDAAWTYVQEGVTFESMFAGALDQWDAYWVRWPQLGVIPFAASFKLLGLGLFQGRVVSWLFGILLIGATLALGSRLYDRTTGTFAALLVSISLPFLQASHYIRPEVSLAAVVVLAFYFLVIGLEEQRAWAFFLSSLLIGLSVDIHQNGAMFAIALAIVFVFEQRKRLWSRHTAGFVAGALSGAAFFVAMQILPSPETYRIISSGTVGRTHLPPLATWDLRVLLRSLDDEIGRFQFYDNNLDFALIGAGLLYSIVRQRAADRRLLAYLSITVAMFVLFVANKHDFYAILFYPFLLVIVASVLVSLVRENRHAPRVRLFVSALALLFVMNSVIHIVRPIVQNRDYQYRDVTDQISSVIPPGSTVVGLPTWWLGLSDYDYRSIMSLTYFHMFNGYSFEEGLDALDPDYLIVDTGFRGLMVNEDYFSTTAGFNAWSLPRPDFQEYMAQRSSLVLEFTNPWHGRFEIYAIEEP